MTRTVSALSLLLALSGAAGAPAGARAQPPQGAAATPAAAAANFLTWEEEVAAWKKTRFDRLQRPDGWLTLVGLGWLKEGDNAIGSDPKSAVVLPAGKAPARLGTLRLAGTGKELSVTFFAEKGVAVTHDGSPVSTLALTADADAKGDDGPTLLAHGSLSFFVIRRGDRLGVRVKDSQAAALKAAFKAEGKKADMGKSCIRFRAPEDLPLATIGKLVAGTSVDAFVARYEASRKRK